MKTCGIMLSDKICNDHKLVEYIKKAYWVVIPHMQPCKASKTTMS